MLRLLPLHSTRSLEKIKLSGPVKVSIREGEIRGQSKHGYILTYSRLPMENNHGSEFSTAETLISASAEAHCEGEVRD